VVVQQLTLLIWNVLLEPIGRVVHSYSFGVERARERSNAWWVGGNALMIIDIKIKKTS